MPLDHPTEFDQINVWTAQPDPYIWLIEITDEGGGPLVDEGGKEIVPRLTPNVQKVTFDGQDYEPYPIVIGNLRRSDQGGPASVPLAFSNAANVLVKLAAVNDYFRDCRVTLTLAHSNYLDSPGMKVTFPGTVTESSISWEALSLTLSAYDDLSFDVPTNLITKRCKWTYRGNGCDFTGDPNNTDLGACPKTLTGCKARGQWEVDNGVVASLQDSNYPKFFGGFPGLLTVFTS